MTGLFTTDLSIPKLSPSARRCRGIFICRRQ